MKDRKSMQLDAWIAGAISLLVLVHAGLSEQSSGLKEQAEISQIISTSGVNQFPLEQELQVIKDDKNLSQSAFDDIAVSHGELQARYNLPCVFPKHMHETAHNCWGDFMAASSSSALPFQTLYAYAKFVEGTGDSSQAIHAFERALGAAKQPSDEVLDAMNRLGLLWIQKERPDLAIIAFERALAWFPKEAAILGNLARGYLDQGNLQAALQWMLAALEVKPFDAEIHHNIGGIYQQLGQLNDAMRHWQMSTALNPTIPSPLFGIAMTLGHVGRANEAVSTFAKAIDVSMKYDPSSLDLARLQWATALLPQVYDSVDDIRVVREEFSKALLDLWEQSPLKLPRNLLVTTGSGSLGYYLVYQGERDKPHRRLLAQIYESSAPQLLHVAPHVEQRRHDTWTFANTKRYLDVNTTQTQSRRIRLGVLSAFLFHHSVGLLLQGVLTRLSNSTYEIILLRFPAREDDVTKRVQAHASRDILLPKDIWQAQAQIAALKLDILLFSEVSDDDEPSGLIHLALRSIVFWGHAVTSGIPSVDYFITSTLFDSRAEDFTETLYKMSSLTTIFHRPRFSFDTSALMPFLNRSRVMYLVPQTLYKLHPAMDAIFAAILDRLPQSYLVLLEGPLPELATQVKERLARTLPPQTMADRVVFVPFLSTDAFLTLCQLADVVLDPFPLGGGRSSFEIFSVGTPIVVHKPRTTVLQLTSAMYTKMGILDCIAKTDEAYVDIALQLGANASYRDAISRQIQDRSSVLFESSSAQVVDDWDRCLHTILALPPPPRLNESVYGFRLNVLGRAIEIHLSEWDKPSQVAAEIAAALDLEPLHRWFVQTQIYKAHMRRFQQAVLTMDLLPGLPPFTFRFGDDVSLAMQYFLWQNQASVTREQLDYLIATVQARLGGADSSPAWIASRQMVRPPSTIIGAPPSVACLTVVVTTCKRLDLFMATMRSFQPYVGRVKICMVLVIDDHSTSQDRDAMKQAFPELSFIYSRRKGHAHSMNLLLDLVTTRYVLYLEDDWQWQAPLPRHPLEHALEVLKVEPHVVQVLLNTQEDSGWRRQDYFLHEFGVVHHSFGYWAGFSLNPGVWDLERLRTCAIRFNETNDIFEREFSLQVWQCGLQVAMLPYTTAVHIGAPPGTNGSAYVLNGMRRRFD
ncbi:hypothetical protein Ae201684P_016837 [Aphanomyces euteiches]|nr:hypothetical protein Ae201684P_016837 [Aphanomyces euteiches]KAH9132823.1 hypothetical protein AeRB84_020887 [Aphanomyces euteiches]